MPEKKAVILPLPPTPTEAASLPPVLTEPVLCSQLTLGVAAWVLLIILPGKCRHRHRLPSPPAVNLNPSLVVNNAQCREYKPHPFTGLGMSAEELWLHLREFYKLLRIQRKRAVERKALPWAPPRLMAENVNYTQLGKALNLPSAEPGRSTGACWDIWER